MTDVQFDPIAFGSHSVAAVRHKSEQRTNVERGVR